MLSRSYTVLILPDRTLTSVGDCVWTRLTVGRESSISDALRMGFIENSDPRYEKPYSSFSYLRARFDIYGHADSGFAGQSLQLPSAAALQNPSLRFWHSNVGSVS